MKLNAVFVSNYTIGSTDNILPLLIELQSRFKELNFIFIFPDLRTYHLNKTNYVIWRAVKSLNPVIFISRANNKVLTLFTLLRIFFKLVFRKNIIFKMTDAIPGHKKFIECLKKVSDVKEIKCYLIRYSNESYKRLHIYQNIVRKRRGHAIHLNLFQGEYDYFFSTLSRKELEDTFHVKALMDNTIKAGYLRRLPQWEKFLAQSALENEIVQGEPYCLYIMAQLPGKRIDVFDEINSEDLLEETLEVLKKYNNEIKIIFKPHPVTNINKLKESLQKIKLTNYKIDMGHAMVLSWGAKFVIAYNWSTTMYDAFYLGKPVIEYNVLDPELFYLYKNWSLGGKCCDFFINRDPKKLEKIIHQLMNKEIRLNRDPALINELFPEPDQKVYDFLDNLFKN